MTYLTVPVAAKGFGAGCRQIAEAVSAGAQMIELRCDYLENLSVSIVEKLIAEVKKVGKQAVPVIVTCRDKRQGGAIDYPVRLRIDVLAGALQGGAEFVDFEYENFLVAENQEKIKRAVSQSLTGRLIMSAHNFEGKFDNISKLYRHILTLYPAAIPKLVYTADHINDCFEGFDLLHTTSGERIVLCMGQCGLISRIMAGKLGGFLSFASLDSESATAAGQLTIGQMKKLYRFENIDSQTEVYGVIASPAGHSLSPAVHNAAFEDMRLNKLYLPLQVDGGRGEFDEFMHNVLIRPWLGFRGFSVTLPHKQNALEFARQNDGFVEPLTEKIDAANTLVIGQERISVYNTDYAGALDAICGVLGIGRGGLKGMAAAVIGAGGVSRAIVAGLADAGAKIKIYNRTVSKAEKLADEFGCYYASLRQLSELNARLLINCTSIGMYPDIDATPIPKEYLTEDMVVFDTVYNPSETLLLKDAGEIGAKTINGTEMFINQALTQFKLFTTKNANAKVMRKRISDRLS